MSAPILSAGSVIRVSGTSPAHGRDRAHLFILAHVKQNGDAIIVPVCSLTVYSDITLIFYPNKSGLPIKHDSFAALHQTKGIPLANYQRKIETGEIEFILQLAEVELQLVIKGLNDSDETPLWAQSWLEK